MYGKQLMPPARLACEGHVDLTCWQRHPRNFLIHAKTSAQKLVLGSIKEPGCQVFGRSTAFWSLIKCLMWLWPVCPVVGWQTMRRSSQSLYLSVSRSFGEAPMVTFWMKNGSVTSSEPLQKWQKWNVLKDWRILQWNKYVILKDCCL